MIYLFSLPCANETNRKLEPSGKCGKSNWSHCSHKERKIQRKDVRRNPQRGNSLRLKGIPEETYFLNLWYDIPSLYSGS